jgi:toxin ParE1/3/4
MKYKFHPDALTEYREAALWYADRERPVAEKFITAVEDAIDRVVEAPTRWRVNRRRCTPLPHSCFPLRNSLHY